MQPAELDTIVKRIKVEDAECVRNEDLKMIREGILEHHRSYSAFDTKLKLHLALDPLSYKVDLEQLTRRSEKTRWRWDPVNEFLSQPTAKGGRVLCIIAGEALICNVATR